MLTPATLTIAVFVVSILLVAGIVLRPEITAARAGKMAAFVALFLLPIISGGLGLSEHFEESKQTTFCLSCHVMAPYGKSLYVDDKHYVAAAHFQNHRIPVDEACYTCHTDYVVYGGVRAKLRGLRHVYVQYLGHVPRPEDIHLYNPYNNRECLHCHLGARSFEDEPTHSAMRDDLISNQTSCLSSGCHDTVHNVKDLDNQKLWKEPR
ncbi:MAG TPA: NapC/NirT family cytochrome c [Terriglobales bacterium]|nr:NapC/NirT family cytochrome c [Terriglobales bacterium]